LALDRLQVAENLAYGARFRIRLWAFHVNLEQYARLRARRLSRAAR